MLTWIFLLQRTYSKIWLRSSAGSRSSGEGSMVSSVAIVQLMCLLSVEREEEKSYVSLLGAFSSRSIIVVSELGQ